jgi:alanyl-tRNA synthetase|mmetsp:Transcript_6417/g.8582  ORF Transcript_6417/g.8582 Transcript_6417/m.8582 type:complete len:261 (+) Transcript_6417:2165-2947(+)|eukprot:Macronucleus_1930.p1 GENE.Macronucleus_1930~~Macronucleus_1930.p1  ORF type:complete len:261 (+),score=93.75 Macronucleus_1930:1-783(+)
MDKAEAELEYGFSLYQGGIVPGNSLRVVNIEGVDTEACCGTHADNTSEVGWVRILRSSRISDGIVRLEYVAQERAIEVLNSEAGILNDLCEAWGVNQEQIKDTALRFFHDSKRLKNDNEKQEKQILDLQVKSVLRDGTNKNFFCRSEQDSPTLYITYLPQFAEEFKSQGKGIVFVGSNFVVGLFGDPSAIQLPVVEEQCTAMSSKPIKKNIKDKVSFKFKEKGKKPINAAGVVSFMITGADFDVGRLVEILESQQIISLD